MGPAKQRTGALLGAALLVGALAGGATGVGGAAALGVLDDSSTSSSQQGGTHVQAAGLPRLRVSPQASTGSQTETAAQQVLPSVVQIYVSSATGSGTGSGVVLSKDGEILTNNHVVEGAGSGARMAVSFSDGRSARAHIVGTDPLTDLAVIKVDGVSGLTPATFGSSRSLQVGESVVAVGAPYGLGSTVTTGIVSALNRPVTTQSESGAGQASVFPGIQTDAAINPGNSGGPLINLEGQVVGINSAIQTASSQTAYGGQGGSIGLGFAIPADEALPIVHQLRQGRTPTHALLGVRVASAADQVGLPSGARIATITPGSGAQRAGLARGDVITRVNDAQITDPDSLVATIRTYRPGQTVRVTYTSPDSTDRHTTRVRLGSDSSS